MPLRALLRYLVNNDRLVQRIAESYPMRRAAQLTIAMFYKSQEKLSKVDPNTIGFIRSVFRRFTQNVREGIEDAKKTMKK